MIFIAHVGRGLRILVKTGPATRLVEAREGFESLCI